MQASALGFLKPLRPQLASPEQGPCLRHCYAPLWMRASSFVALVYGIACILYLLIVCVYRVPSPFADSLTDEQRDLKRRSAKTRLRVFILALLLATMFVILIPSSLNSLHKLKGADGTPGM